MTIHQIVDVIDLHIGDQILPTTSDDIVWTIAEIRHYDIVTEIAFDTPNVDHRVTMTLENDDRIRRITTTETVR